MGADLHIQHCRLRIARRGGWSWGADTDSLLEAAVQRLPALIGARLATLWPQDIDCNIVTPLRLRVSVRLEELLELAAESAETQSGSLPQGPLAQRIDALLREIVQREAVGALVGAEEVVEGTPSLAAVPAPSTLPDVHALWAGNVLTVLLGWHRQGVLEAQLLMFSLAALNSWHASLLQSQVPAAREGDVNPALAELAVLHARQVLPLAPGPIATLVRRLCLMVAAAHDLGVFPSDPALLAVLRTHAEFALTSAPLPPAPPSGVGMLASSDASPCDRQQTAGVIPAQARVPAMAGQYGGGASTRYEMKVASALPFLMLGPLSRTGYLQTLGAVFEAADLLPALPVLAAAMTRKVLAPPQRGWFRSAQAQQVGAAFAGLREAPPDPLIADVAHQLLPLLSPLDATVAKVLTSGHAKEGTLVLQAVPQNGEAGWLLWDEEGMFAIAWAECIERLFGRIAEMGGPLLLVPQAAVVPGLLTSLDEGGCRFVTDAPPARAETWRALFPGTGRAWTNEHALVTPLINEVAARLPDAGAASAAVWAGFAERTLLAGAAIAPLERSLALAASLALGTLGWSLWRDREAVTPLLAMERFGDMDAVVAFSAEVVQVRLPLGRRYMDLKQAGWLDDVADVPWLDGRPLRFSQG
jgi:hypothetical protein